MKRRIRLWTFAVAASVALMAASCSSKAVNKGYQDDIPVDIQRLIDKEYNEAIYAVGTANGPTEAIAQDKAVMAARAEIARLFQSQIDVLQKRYEETVNNKGAEEYQQVMETFATLEMRGSQIAKSMVRPERSGRYSAKALVVISAEQMKQIVDEKMSSYTSFRAAKAYEELEQRVERERNRQAEN